jgi:hypothetical protein
MQIFRAVAMLVFHFHKEYLDLTFILLKALSSHGKTSNAHGRMKSTSVSPMLKVRTAAMLLLLTESWKIPTYVSFNAIGYVHTVFHENRWNNDCNAGERNRAKHFFLPKTGLVRCGLTTLSHSTVSVWLGDGHTTMFPDQLRLKTKEFSKRSSKS